MSEPTAEWYEMLDWLKGQAHPLAQLAADQVARIQLLRDGLLERDQEVADLRQQVRGHREMLVSVGAVLHVAGRAMRGEAAAHDIYEAARDNAPMRNLLATAYGLDPLGSPLPPKRAKKAKATV